MDILDRLLGHDAWTTRQILLRCLELKDADLRQPFDIGHETIHETLTHMIGNVRTWTDLMNGAADVSSSPSLKELSVAQLIEYHDRAASDFASLARRIRDEDRLDEFWIDILDEPPTAKTYGGAITHVITHNMHHRGELLHMLQRLGIPELPEGDALSWEAIERSSTA